MRGSLVVLSAGVMETGKSPHYPSCTLSKIMCSLQHAASATEEEAVETECLF